MHTNKAELKTTLTLAIPIIVDQLGTVLMGMADTVQVGHMLHKAKESVAAAAIGNGIFFTIAIIGLLAIQISGPMIAHKFTENNKPEIRKIWHSSIAVSLFLAIICFSIIEILISNIHIFKQDPAIITLAIPFLHYLSFSIFPLFLFTALRQLSDGLSNTRLAMIITLVAVAINIGLNQILIFGTSFSPALGLYGSGLATFISRIIMCGALYWVLSQKYKDYFSINFLEKAKFKYLLKVGLPSGLQGFFEIALFAAAAMLMGQIGITQLAAHQVALNPASVSYMMVMGISAAGGIRIGANLNQPQRLRQVGLVALGIGLVFMACTCIVFLLANKFIAQAYTADPSVIAVATGLLTIAGFFQLSDGLQGVALGVLRGMKDVNVPTIITLIAYWLIGLPVAYFLAFTKNMGATGIWIGLTLGLTSSAILLCWRFWYKTKS